MNPVSLFALGIVLSTSLPSFIRREGDNLFVRVVDLVFVFSSSSSRSSGNSNYLLSGNMFTARNRQMHRYGTVRGLIYEFNLAVCLDLWFKTPEQPKRLGDDCNEGRILSVVLFFYLADPDDRYFIRLFFNCVHGLFQAVICSFHDVRPFLLYCFRWRLELQSDLRRRTLVITLRTSLNIL